MTPEHKATVHAIVAGIPDDAADVEETEKPEDEDAEAGEAAKRSAFVDFLSAVGLPKPKRLDAAMEALEEFLGHCGNDDDDE